MSFARLSLFLSAGALVFAACSEQRTEKIDAQKVTETTRRTLTGHLEQINESVELVAATPFFVDADRLFDDFDDPQTVIDREEIDELVAELETRLFAPSTIESETDERIVYLVSGSRVCDGDIECVQAIDDVGIRLAVTSPAEGALDIEVLVGVGSAQVRPFLISLAENSVAVEVELSQLKRAIEAFGPNIDVGLDDLPMVANGRIAAILTRNASLDYTGSIEVRDAIEIAGDGYSLSIAARSTPIAVLRLDGNARRLYSDLDLGSVDVTFPAAPILESMTCGFEDETCGPFHGVFSAHLAGASASVELSNSLDRLLITNVGIGDDTSFVRLDQTDLITVDVNELHGRRFDVELAGFDDFIEAKLSEAFVLDLGLDLAPLADQVDDLPAWTGHDRMSIEITGSTAPQVRIGEGDETTRNGEVVYPVSQVIAGSLNLVSEQAPLVTANAGECLFVRRDVNDSIHPFSHVLSATCP